MLYPGSLHCHSDYSNLRGRDSINRFDQLIDYAIELGHSAIAFTEHENVSNAIKIEEYYKTIKKDYPDFKVIRGNEIYLCRDGLTNENFTPNEDYFYHFILLAKNAKGHQQIRELSTRAWERSFRRNNIVRVPTYYQDILDIIQTEPGNVIGTTACLGGFLPHKILEYVQNPNEELYNKICHWCHLMENIFGKGNFYLELQPARYDDQILVNKCLLTLSEKLDIPYIITNDAHYAKETDRSIHKAFLNADSDSDREVDSFYAYTYLMGDNQIRNLLDYLTEEQIERAYNNIQHIIDSCEDYSLLRPLKIPCLEWKKPALDTIPEHYYSDIPNLRLFTSSDFDGDLVLAKMIISKIESDTRLQNKLTYDAVNSNLDATWRSSEVNNTHWSAYFLNLQRIIDVCWEAGTLVGPGRGSGVGFLLLYLLDIIQINPLWEKTSVFEWRFLNPERVSVLDIDTDIEGCKRSQVIQHLREVYGADMVSNVITFKTEKSKSAIQTAARGLGIDVDEAIYLSSLIPVDRGQVRTLQQCYYGDEDKGYKPVATFVNEMNNNYQELWRVAQNIEGLINGIGEHAGGIIFVDEPFVNSTALMKVPNGDTVTQFDLHDSEKASLIKIDLLSVECLDKIHSCLDLLTEYGYLDKNKELRQKYEDCIGIYNLERDDPAMWQMVWNHKITSLFQMEQQSGIQGIATLKPTSVDDLAVLNSTIRLMAQEGATERPTDKLARFKRNPKAWDNELQQWGLGPKEKAILAPSLNSSYGLCIAQEQFMQLVQLPELGGFSLTWADKLRKSIAKKNPKEFDALAKEFYDTTEQLGINKNFTHYVWEVLISMSKGYGFNQSHTLAYSLVALQEMNLCFRYPIIYWNTACLMVNSGTLEDNSTEEIVDIYAPEKDDIANGCTFIDLPDRAGKIKKTASTQYDKLARAIGKMRDDGVIIKLPDINVSVQTFRPDEATNSISCGFKSIMGVGDDIIEQIIKNRPYTSVKDFIDKINPRRNTMISLIKSGAFDNLSDRKSLMTWYIWNTCDKKTKLNLQNMASLLKYELLPINEPDYEPTYKLYEFTRYLKTQCKSNTSYYTLDTRAINFISNQAYDNLLKYTDNQCLLDIKTWDKVYQKSMDKFRDYIKNNQNQLLAQLNQFIFRPDWVKYSGRGNVSAWEMEVLCFYYHEHELQNVNMTKYGIQSFSSLSEDPVIESSGKNNKGYEWKRFKLTKICGTCIAKDKAKGMVSLLTTTGVVNVKFRKEYFTLFDKQISERNPDGTKTVKERSWFNRGSMIMVMGFRSGDDFIVKKYNNSVGHQLYKIDDIDKEGNLILRGERYKGEEEEDE